VDIKLNVKKCKLTLDTRLIICKNVYINGKYYHLIAHIKRMKTREEIWQDF